MKLVLTLTPSQYKKLLNLEAVNVGKPKAGSSEYVCVINNKQAAKRLAHALLDNKGMKLSGQFVSSIVPLFPNGGSLKSIGKSIKKGFSKAGDTLKGAAFDVNKSLKNNRVANAIVYNVAPELAGELTKTAVEAGFASVGLPGVGSVLAKPLAKGANSGVKTALKTEGYGSGIRGYGAGLKPLKKNTLTPILENDLAHKVNGDPMIALQHNRPRADMSYVRSFRKAKSKGSGSGIVGY